MFDRRLLIHFDWVLCGVLLLVCFAGQVAMYSATFGDPQMASFRERQMLWLALGLLAAFFSLLIDYRWIVKWGSMFHFVFIGLLLLVLIMGTGGPGSPVKRWLAVGPFFIQPSEFIKFSLILVSSSSISSRLSSSSALTASRPCPSLVSPKLNQEPDFLMIS